MRPVRIALQLQPQHADYAANRDTVRRAEDMGVDVIFNWDHFYPLYGEPDGKHFECWTMLGAWAEQTSRVEIGVLVTCNSDRNPELLAKMARTVDNMSDGRLIFGIGSGGSRRDDDEYGYEFGRPVAASMSSRPTGPASRSGWGRLNPRTDPRQFWSSSAAAGRRRCCARGDMPRSGTRSATSRTWGARRGSGRALCRRRRRPGRDRAVGGKPQW